MHENLYNTNGNLGEGLVIEKMAEGKKKGKESTFYGNSRIMKFDWFTLSTFCNCVKQKPLFILMVRRFSF